MNKAKHEQSETKAKIEQDETKEVERTIKHDNVTPMKSTPSRPKIVETPDKNEEHSISSKDAMVEDVRSIKERGSTPKIYKAEMPSREVIKEESESSRKDISHREPSPIEPKDDILSCQTKVQKTETPARDMNKDKIQVFSDDDDSAYEEHLKQSRAKVVDHLDRESDPPSIPASPK